MAYTPQIIVEVSQDALNLLISDRTTWEAITPPTSITIGLYSIDNTIRGSVINVTDSGDIAEFLSSAGLMIDVADFNYDEFNEDTIEDGLYIIKVVGTVVGETYTPTYTFAALSFLRFQARKMSALIYDPVTEDISLNKNRDLFLINCMLRAIESAVSLGDYDRATTMINFINRKFNYYGVTL